MVVRSYPAATKMLDAAPRLAGQAAIREYTRRLVSSPLRVDAFEVTDLYETQDPEVVIAEVRVTATVTTTGRSFDATSIQVLRIRDGRILLFRDFANPRALEDALRA
jgi:ketosteroid isomerase-like protein